MELVRASDCRLRNLALGDRTTRRWTEDDSPLSNGDRYDVFGVEPESTPYVLETQNLDLVVTGSFDNIRQLLETVQSQNRFLHTVALDIQTDAVSEIQLHWELSVFCLTHAPEAQEEDDRDDGSQS
jgi:hypothetical protein